MSASSVARHYIELLIGALSHVVFTVLYLHDLRITSMRPEVLDAGVLSWWAAEACLGAAASYLWCSAIVHRPGLRAMWGAVIAVTIGCHLAIWGAWLRSVLLGWG